MTHRGVVLDHVKHYDIIECDTCGFRHLNPIPTPPVLDEFYKAQYYQTHKPNYIKEDDRDAQFLNIAFDERLDLFERLTTGRRLLDVGCGAGQFLKYAQGRGWQAQGVEPSSEAAQSAAQRGVSVFAGSFEAFAENRTDTYDVICLKNILEHLPEPTAFLERCRSLLTKKGVLFVEVPNDYDASQRAGVALLKVRKSWLAVPDHINYFSFDSLRALLRRLGYRPVHRTTTFPIYALLLLGYNFIADPSKGPKAHQVRIGFELFFERLGLRALKGWIYRFLSLIGLGRTVIFYCYANE